MAGQSGSCQISTLHVDALRLGQPLSSRTVRITPLSYLDHHHLPLTSPLRPGQEPDGRTGEAMAAVLGIPPYLRTPLLSYTNVHIQTPTRPAVGHSRVTWQARTSDSLFWKQLPAHIKGQGPEEEAEPFSHSRPAWTSPCLMPRRHSCSALDWRMRSVR